LIQGETGTGKELLAKVIHYNSDLKDKPFIAENCGALSENLLESELFGHVKGAFTGAIADKKGLFELADGGTVFLEKFAEKLNQPIARLTPWALDLLVQFDWPGNVRELENEIERALTLAGEDREIQAGYLSEKITGTVGQDAVTQVDGMTLHDAIERMELQMVTRALGDAGGNRSKAARILGLTRQGLLNKIARYKIET